MTVIEPKFSEIVDDGYWLKSYLQFMTVINIKVDDSGWLLLTQKLVKVYDCYKAKRSR